jgi:hypothetical protein
MHNTTYVKVLPLTWKKVHSTLKILNSKNILVTCANRESIAVSQNLSILKKFVILMHLWRKNNLWNNINKQLGSIFLR